MDLEYFKTARRKVAQLWGGRERAALRRRLLSTLGKGRLPPRDAPMWLDARPKFVEKLVAEGQHFGPCDRIARRAVMNGCHDASFDWACKHNGTLWSGFATSDDDGLWRVHSFAVDRRGKLVECTPVRRDAYFAVPIKTAQDLEVWHPELRALLHL